MAGGDALDDDREGADAHPIPEVPPEPAAGAVCIREASGNVAQTRRVSGAGAAFACSSGFSMPVTLVTPVLRPAVEGWASRCHSRPLHFLGSLSHSRIEPVSRHQGDPFRIGSKACPRYQRQ